MKWIFAALLAALALAPSLVLADDVRHGVVMQIKPIDNRGDDESDQHKQGRKVGRGVGALLGGLSLGKLGGGVTEQVVARNVADTGDQIGGNVAGQGPSAHYMVSVKMDDGRTVSLVQPGPQVQGLQAGSKVSVTGAGDSAVIRAE